MNTNPLKQPISVNPLSAYYRRPGTYITLPTGGKFYKQPPTLSDTGELAVYPMTAKDELILKNPDALLNGEALKIVIASVCPDIKNVNEIPAPDIDPILVAMRMASYGDDLGIDVNHNCTASDGKSQHVTIGLGTVLSTTTPIAETHGTVTLSTGIVVELKPYTLEAQSRVLRVQFVTMRQLQAAEANDKMSIDEKAAIANRGYDELVALSQDIMGLSILSVTLPDGVKVTQPSHIAEWVLNLDRATADRLDKELKGFNEYGITRDLSVKCDYCGEQFTTDMMFDPTSFFVGGS